MIQLIQLPLADRLKIEALKRIHAGVFFQLLMFSFLAFYCASEPQQSPSFILGLITGVLLVCLRGFLFAVYSKNILKLVHLFHFQMFTTIMSALVYGLLVADSVLYFKTFNAQVIILIYISIGMMTAVLSSLAPTPVYQRFYFALVSIPIFVTLFNPNLESIFRNVGVLVLIYVAYLIYGSRGISRDLKNVYQAEMHARQQQETFQQVIDLVPGFVGLTDSAGEWITTSESFEKIRHHKSLTEVFEQFKNSNLYKFTREISWTYQNEQFAFIMSMQKYLDHSMIVVGVPAEEILEMRQQLDSQRLKAEFSARLATLGEMAGGIAHEVNNPLAVIIGNCSQIERLINEAELDREKIQDKIEKISRTSFRISKIVSGLRSFSRQSDHDPFVLTELAQLFDETLELCREKFYQNSIRLEIAPIPKIQIPIRSVQISQVIINLLNNSFDAVKNLEQKTIQVQFEVTEKNLFIRVTDSGLGVSAHIVDRIFDPFFTTKEIGQGTGLGLSISRSILLDHQGEIHLLGKQPQTTFQIRLPLLRQSMP